MAKKLAHIIATLFGGKRTARGTRGESLVEVLVSITIGGLALLMMAMAISVASNMAMDSRDYMNNYYNANAAAISDGAAPIGAGTATLTIAGSTASEVSLVKSGDLMKVSYYENDEIGANGVVLYGTATTTVPVGGGE